MIKKLLFISCLAAGITFSSYAQKRKWFTLGVRGGISLSTLTSIESDYKTDFYIGVQLPIHLSRFYSLQPELNYTRQGAKNANFYGGETFSWSNSHTKNAGTTTVDLSYIDVNVINKFRFKKFNLHIGPGLAFLLEGSKYTDTNVDLTLNLGAGYKVTERLEIEARWRTGLLSIVDDYGYWNQNNYYKRQGDDVLNSTFQIGATFTF
ncbi:hypothetical protein M2306_002987 [Myroides gitamensis]|uniref:porin family protein n=1 Tax=Myroides odoratus TaxID=256 RepID=UPI00216A9D82|nr:porin family protein [Myroides odoratus]MCS4239325.1 hypothetical protein [Myroides odoratus]MDH6602293.1 hypothetical protein [Myroides gitamensis]